MREAIGGALLIKLVMFFIVIYVCFLAIAINYSITFRVKNQIINLIEEYEGYELAKESIDKYIDDVGYYKTDKKLRAVYNNDPNSTCASEGYCITKLTSTRGYYYKVTAYVTFDFPILGSILQFPVSGETKVIYTG